MILSDEITKNLIKESQQIRWGLQQTPFNNTKEALSRFENILTTYQLENCLMQSSSEELMKHVAEVLSIRWKRIWNSSMDYTHQPLNKVNLFCLKVAIALSPLPKNDAIDDLPPAKGPYFLLMPTLKAHQDVYGQNIHRFKLHEFILSDDASLFIPLEECLNHAFESDTGKFEHVVSIDNTYPELTSSELSSVYSHSTFANAYYEAIINFNQQRFFGKNLSTQLTQLNLALRAGGVHKSGEELNAGASANIGIIAFNEYWMQLTEAEKKEIYQKYPVLADALGRLMRPTDTIYTETRFCVELIANSIEPIINQINSEEELYVIFRNNVIEKQQQFLLEAKKKNYCLPENDMKIPRILREIFESSPQEQMEIFKYEEHGSGLLYALENQPLALPDYINQLDIKLKNHAIHAKFKNNDSALIIAAKHGGVDAVCILLELGAKTEECDLSHRTALHWAASNGHLDVVLHLLDFNADIETISQGVTALNFAIIGKHIAVVHALLENGASINGRNNEGKNSLDIAIDQSPELVELLLLKAINVCPEEQVELLRNISEGIYKSVLMYAACCKPNVLHELLGRNNIRDNSILFSKNRYGQSLLMLAVIGGNAEAVRILIELGLCVNELDFSSNSALIWAVHHQHLDVVNLLLEKKINLNYRHIKDSNALDIAITRNPELIKALLIKAIAISRAEQKELLKKISGGIYHNILMYTACCKPIFLNALLETIQQNHYVLPSSILNSRDKYGQSLMILAAKSGNAVATRILLSLNADIEAHDINYNTALHWAANNAHLDVLNLLLENSECIDARNKGGNTPLNSAVQNGHIAIVNSLLEKGSNINARNNKGNNALDLAIKYCPELIELLLRKARMLSSDEQTKILHNISDGIYKNILVYVAFEQPHFFSEMLNLCGVTPENYAAIEAEMNQFFDFDTHLQPIKTKLLEMEKKVETNKRYTKAVTTAKALIITLVSEKFNFILAEGDMIQKKSDLKNNCLAAIKIARPILETHRELTKAVSMLIVAIAAFPISMALHAKGFFSLQTDTAQKLKTLESNIKTLQLD